MMSVQDDKELDKEQEQVVGYPLGPGLFHLSLSKIILFIPTVEPPLSPLLPGRSC